MLLVLEVEESENTLFGVTRSFQTMEDPRPVSRVVTYGPEGSEGSFDVVGWSADGPVTAFAALVDDSGEGSALLLYGGEEGIRLRPEGSTLDWSLEEPTQWGEPFLLLAHDTLAD